MYIDTSIRFNSNEIASLFEKSKEVGILSRYIQETQLPCFTDKKMFEWFGETSKTFTEYKSAEANFIIIRNNFLTSLIMKAWITCALDESCISPKFAHIYGSPLNWIFGCGICGCHRFDQDALTIVNSFLDRKSVV